MVRHHDLRNTLVRHDAQEQRVERAMGKGIEIGIKFGIRVGVEVGSRLERREIARRLHASGRTLKEIAEVLGISTAEVRRLARR